MITVLWASLAAVALLWPARLAGPLDGVPLDAPLEAAVLGVLLAWLVVSHPLFLRQKAPRALIVALLLWKAATSAMLVQDGWCLKFTLPVPVFVDGVTVPHSWDVRADWLAPVPRCSAIMTGGYTELERFPAWFYNLAPANWDSPVHPGDRPPGATSVLDLTGYLHATTPGRLQVLTGEDLQTSAEIDGAPVTARQLVDGVPLSTGEHRVAIHADLQRTHWSLVPLWDGGNLWSATTATVDSPSSLDRWLRPWGRVVPAVLIAAFLLLGFGAMWRRASDVTVTGVAFALTAIAAGLALSGRESWLRLVPLLFFGVALLKVPRRAQGVFGWSLLVALPFLTMFMIFGAHQAGLFTWYSSGDDWWMFQRYAYRIFMQGYWLEGGQPTFWFQPLYRWIAGSLHMVFGDSSVGELFWDASAALVGSAFAFQVTRRFAGYRWGIVASAITLSIFTLGPGWYLFGRGLSEFSSMSFIYAAGLLALRGRHGYWPAIAAAGILATLGFYARLNNLPMALMVAAFAWPVRQPIGDLYHPSRWLRRVSRPVLAGALGGIAAGMWLFTARTYHYTGAIDMLYGTQATFNSVWHAGDSYRMAAERLFSSLMMLLTVNDPPRFDVRALPVLLGFAAAIAGGLGVRPFSRLPMNLVAFSLAGVVGAFVARGSAYPGRFSTHLVPVTVTLAVCALSLFVSDPRRRSAPPAHPPPGTT